jgi:hypothetical protein
MTAVHDSVRDELASAFSRYCAQLAEARRRQRRKDTPSNRDAVAECRARVDAVLDLYLDIVWPQRKVASSAPSAMRGEAVPPCAW